MVNSKRDIPVNIISQGRDSDKESSEKFPRNCETEKPIPYIYFDQSDDK